MEQKKVGESKAVLTYWTLPEDANPAGNIHGGVILKLIDNTAAVVAMRHCRRNTVTASIDRVQFLQPVYVGEVLTLKASLNLVATTSMEIGVRVEAEDLLTGEIRHTASAYLTYVALDRNHKPTPVPGLILESDEDRRRHEAALARREIRLTERNRARSGAKA